jgi:hypothetical protein
MNQVVALIAINLVIGFTGNIDWRAHVGGLVTGALLALAFDAASAARHVPTEILLNVGAAAAMVAVLALLVFSIAPGHVNLT